MAVSMRAGLGTTETQTATELIPPNNVFAIDTIAKDLGPNVRFRRRASQIRTSNERRHCGHRGNLHAVSMTDQHWTYEQWAENTVEKIVSTGLALPEEHRADWLRLQIGLAIGQALRHGRSGRDDDDLIVA